MNDHAADSVYRDNILTYKGCCLSWGVGGGGDWREKLKIEKQKLPYVNQHGLQFLK